MHYCKYLIFLLCLFPAALQAQDITGLWKGTLYNDTNKLTYSYEVAISEEKGKLVGFSHTWFILDDKQYYGVKKVKIRKRDGKIIIEDNGLISNNYPIAPAKGVRQLNILELDGADSVMRMTGPFTTNATKIYNSLTGHINLQRKNDYWQSALVPHLQELGLVKELSFVKDDPVLARNEQEMELIKASIARASNKTISKPAVARVDNIAIEKIPVKETPVIPRSQPSSDSSSLARLEPAKPKQLEPAREISNKAPLKKAGENPLASTTVPVTKNIAPAKQPASTTVEPGIKPPAQPAVATKAPAKQPVVVAAKKEAQPIAKATVPKDTKAQPVVVSVPAPVKQVMEIKPAPALQPATSKEKPTDNKATDPSTDSKALNDNLAKTGATLPVLNGRTAPALNLFNRTTLLQQTVLFKSDSLLITLYDNGEVDGDTVSVVMNGNVIMARQGLSTNAVRKTIYIDPSTDSVQLVMYAENLGSIPPNTGLLVVRDGRDLYEIRFSGDLQKNAAILFRRKK